MHPCALAYIIVCRLATGDTRPPLPYLSFGCRFGPDIHGSDIVMAFEVSSCHLAILTASNECPPFSDSWIWPFVGLRHLAIYMACPLYHSSSFVCEFSEQLYTFFGPPARTCIWLHFHSRSMSLRYRELSSTGARNMPAEASICMRP